MSLILRKNTGAIFTITLNRPDKYNSLTEPMALELQQALEEAGEPAYRCVILRAEGKAFCAGQDLPEVLEKSKLPGYLLSDTVHTSYNPIITAIRYLEKPVICAVQGTAAGAGANIAFACDLVVASKEAYFVQAFSNIGLIPDCGGTWFLPRLVGLARTNALYMLNEKISADEAVQTGLIYKAVEHEELDQKTEELANKLAHMPTKGFALYKNAVNSSYTNSFQEQLKLEAELQSLAGTTNDFNEGMSAFTEKRKASYRGY